MECCTQIIEETGLCLKLKYRKLGKQISKQVMRWGNVRSTSFTGVCENTNENRVVFKLEVALALY